MTVKKATYSMRPFFRRKKTLLNNIMKAPGFCVQKRGKNGF